jgi:hypothetical protein
MMAGGQPVTLDAIRTFVGAPSAEQLAAATVDETLEFVRCLVDPRKCGREATGVHHRRGGRSANPERRAAQRRARDLGGEREETRPRDVSRRILPEFVLGKRSPPMAGDPPAVLEPREEAKYPDVLEHQPGDSRQGSSPLDHGPASGWREHGWPDLPRLGR